MSSEYPLSCSSGTGSPLRAKPPGRRAFAVAFRPRECPMVQRRRRDRKTRSTRRGIAGTPGGPPALEPSPVRSPGQGCAGSSDPLVGRCRQDRNGWSVSCKDPNRLMIQEQAEPDRPHVLDLRHGRLRLRPGHRDLRLRSGPHQVRLLQQRDGLVREGQISPSVGSRSPSSHGDEDRRGARRDHPALRSGP